MNKLKNYLLLFLLLLLIIILFKYNYLLSISVFNSTKLWLEKVFPTLFIMFIINDIVINSNILNDITNIINPFFNKIFNTSGNSSLAFILALFSGTPSSAFILTEMLNNKQIDVNDANKLIACTYFSNPLFLYNILNLSFNKLISIKIILIHYISNIFIGILFRGKTKKIFNNYLPKNNKKISIFSLLPNSIKKSFDTLLIILGIITFYMIITDLIIKNINMNINFQIILKGIFEITQSLNNLNLLNYSGIIKEIIAISIISFGGLSIHTQILSIINNTDISYKNFFRGRIYHVLISVTIYLLI